MALKNTILYALADHHPPGPKKTSVRIALAAFIEERDVDRLADCLATLAAGD